MCNLLRYAPLTIPIRIWETTPLIQSFVHLYLSFQRTIVRWALLWEADYQLSRKDLHRAGGQRGVHKRRQHLVEGLPAWDIRAGVRQDQPWYLGRIPQHHPRLGSTGTLAGNITSSQTRKNTCRIRKSSRRDGSSHHLCYQNECFPQDRPHIYQQVMDRIRVQALLHSDYKSL